MAFFPGPMEEDVRIYHTGNLGCQLADDCMAHAGRNDFQVKIRGHRIEIAEVEMALLAITGIRDVAACAGENRLSGTRHWSRC